MKTFVKAISYYLPKNIISNEQLALEFPEWSVEKIANKVGIKERHLVNEFETGLDLAYEACLKLFNESEFDKKEIDFILLCTQSPDYFLPGNSCLLQNKLELGQDVGAVDINLGCSGYVYGLSIAKGLLASNAAKNVLFITTDTYSKFIHNRDKGNRTIFGDGASASIISSQNGFAEIGNFHFGTDGAGAENLIVRGGAIKSKNTNGPLKSEFGDDYLFMNGPAIFHFTADKVPSIVTNTLSKNNIAFEQIDYFLFHQANAFMLEHVRKKTGISPEKFLIKMDFAGNTVSSTIPIALKEYITEQKFNTGDTILLAGFGVGYSWAGTILTVC